MQYSTLMVRLGLDQSNSALLQVASHLAEKHDADVIGVAACSHTPPAGYMGGEFAGSLLAKDLEQVSSLIADAKQQFYSALSNRNNRLSWQSALARPTDFVTQQTRYADLLITGPSEEGFVLDPFRFVDVKSVVMQSSCPTMMVPLAAKQTSFTKAVVAWKDSREARRAVFDALPLLQELAGVSVLEVVDHAYQENEATTRVSDVAEWLKRHGVKASYWTMSDPGEPADLIMEHADHFGAEVLVSGAYGHSRLREWAFGGVTEYLLDQPERCCLFVH